MTLIIYTPAYEDSQPSVERVIDGFDRVLWADEINGGWGLSNDQQARVDGDDVIEHRGWLVMELMVADADKGPRALVAAWDEALVAPKPVVTVRIENAYEDGHESETTVEVEAPKVTAEEIEDDDLSDWWNDVVYDHTGDGHSADIGSCYTATITKADSAKLVGMTYEWVD